MIILPVTEMLIAVLGVMLVLYIGWLVLDDVREQYDYAVLYCNNITNGNITNSPYYCVNGTVQGAIDTAMTGIRGK